MKRSFILLFTLALALPACVKDASNHTIRPLDEVTISGIDEVYDNVYIDQVFRLTPKVESRSGGSEHFKYLWVAYDKTTYYEADTLAKTKELNYDVHLLPGEHTVKFKVIDEKSGVYYEKQFTVHVVNEYTKGVLILSRIGKEAKLDFWLNESDKLIESVYKKMNEGQSLGQSPRRVYYNKFTSVTAGEVMVFCAPPTGGQIIDPLTMKKRREVKDLFFEQDSEAVDPVAYFKSTMRQYLINGPHAHDRATNSSTPSPTVKPAMIVESGEARISAVGNFNDDEQPASRAVLYDDKNGCFYAITGITTAFLTPVRQTPHIAYIDGHTFDPDHVGMRCLYGGICGRMSNGEREYLGVFEDNTGKRHLLKMSIGFYVEPDGATYFKDTFAGPLTSEAAASATTFATSALFNGYLFYTKGDGIYVFNSIDQVEQLIYRLPTQQNEPVTINHIEFQRGESALLVAFHAANGSKGTAGFCRLLLSTDGGLRVTLTNIHHHMADEILDFESKY